MTNKSFNQTTGGIDHILLDELEKCFTVDEEVHEDGVVVVTHFDRERAKDLVDEFANRIAVGRSG